MSLIKTIHTDRAPKPAGHYSQAVQFQNLLFISGQLATDTTGKKHTEKSAGEQTQLIFQNIGCILDEAGSQLHRLLSVTIYISDIEFWPEVNAVYERILGPHKPARAVVPVAALHYGFKVEIQAIAAV